ncbi:TlpA disulfide reductase family protein (plasmid) [Deinococcus radiomollis]|uniref:TlpA family protein disulfide reductase n=1 Tax=Deinococcus radiomollis TaxID=468916 RepID=UPI0038912871
MTTRQTIRPRCVPALLTVAVVLSAGVLYQQVNAAPARVAVAGQGEPINAVLPKLNGTPMNLASYRGKVLVVNLFAAWCASCWNELKGFQRVSAAYASKGVTVVGVSVQSSPQDTRNMISKLGLTFSVGLDAQGSVSQEKFNLRAMPTTLFFDRSGKLIESHPGELDEETLRSKLDHLL